MKVCVLGLGAVGGWIAAWLGSRLPAGAVQLSAVARGATLAAVRAQGLRLLGDPAQAQEDVRVPLQASDQPASLGAQDLVVLAVKGPALAAAARAVPALCGPHTQVLVAMNGVPWWFFDGLPGPCAGLRLHSVDPGDVVRALVPTERVIGCVVHGSSSTPAPGCVRHGAGRRLILGRPDGHSDAALQQVAALLEAAGFEAPISPRIQQDVWFKLWGNMTMNPVSALTGATADRILDDPLVRDFCSRVMREAQAVGAAIGIPINEPPEARHAVTRKLGALRTSMLQDVEAGRPLEIDALLGAVREIAGQVQIATPDLDALLGLVRLMARQRGLAPAAGTC